jgi:hypothetical protein
MAKFSSSNWFSKKGANPTVTLAVPLTDGEGAFKMRLKGQLSSATAAGAAELAKNQVDKVGVSKPKVTTDGGSVLTESKKFEGDEVSELILGTEAFFTGADDGKK